MENNKLKKVFSIIGKLLYYVVIAFICLIALFLLYYIISSQINANNEDYKPKVSIYTIVSPSMTPVINVYDVVINIREDKPENIKVGDIITYVSKSSTSEGMTITHRVIDVIELPDGGYEYQTQGDNNSEPDSLYVGYDQILGKEILIIPYLGRIQFLIANQKGWLFLLLIPVSIYTFIEIYKLFNLFGIKKKVKEVIDDDSNDVYAKQKEELENARKEKIKEELKAKQVNMNPIPLPTTKEEIDEYKKDAVEILDTDPLTTRIKEYDDRINQLDKVLQKMAKEVPVDVVEEEIVDEDNYLKGGRIRITKTEEAKKRKQKTETNEQNNSNQIVDLTVNEETENKNTNFDEIVPLVNEREKIKRPQVADLPGIDERTEKIKKTSKRETLNLNPRKIKKVKRASSNRNNKRNLNLNPKNIKKINRNRKNTKKKLIVIEKKK